MFFFIGAGAIVTSVATPTADVVPIALAHGLALAVAVSAFGALSGGHFNPAVTFGLAVAGKHPWDRVPTYWIAQLAGGLVAGFALRYAFDFSPSAADRTHLGTPSLAPGVGQPEAIVIEAILTLFLLWAVFGTAISPLAPRIAGFGIGLTVLVDILAGGPLTGAAMNPARYFGTGIPALFLERWWVYVVGPLGGGLLGGLLWRYAFAPVVPAVSTQR